MVPVALLTVPAGPTAIIGFGDTVSGLAVPAAMLAQLMGPVALEKNRSTTPQLRVTPSPFVTFTFVAKLVVPEIRSQVLLAAKGVALQSIRAWSVALAVTSGKPGTGQLQLRVAVFGSPALQV